MTKKEQTQRKYQKKFYKDCLERAIKENNKEDIEYYKRQLSLMDFADFIKENCL